MPVDTLVAERSTAFAAVHQQTSQQQQRRPMQVADPEGGEVGTPISITHAHKGTERGSSRECFCIPLATTAGNHSFDKPNFYTQLQLVLLLTSSA